MNKQKPAASRSSLLVRPGTVRLLVLLALLTPGAFAVSTQFWTTATYEEFARGNLSSVSLGRDGSMSLSPELVQVLDTEQAMVWAVAEDARGNIYLGTGHSGKVYRLDRSWNSEVVFDAGEPDVFALAVDRDNRLYVGTSPDGRVYRVDTSGEATEFFDPRAKYIWSLSFAPDGALYVGTGDRGRIFRVLADGSGEPFYDTNQTHVMSLALSPEGDLIAGTEPNGLLFKVSSAGRGFVIYDSPLAEIHKISLAPDGSIYAAVMGGTDPRQVRPQTPQQAGPQAPVTATTTITVRASDDPLQLPDDQLQMQVPGQQGGQDPQDPQAPQAPQSAQDPASAGAALAPAPRAAARPQTGPPRSAIVRIRPDGSSQTLWSSPGENAFGLAPSPGRLLFSTDDKGRIYQLVNDRELSLLTQTDQEQTTRLVPIGDSVLVTTANLGKVYRLGTQPAETGTYESEVRDAGNTAAWGQIRWQAGMPAGTSLQLHTRSGNSSRPDSTWSDWSEPYDNPGGQVIKSPPARYMQWKAVFHSAGSQSPVLNEVTLAYLPRNRSPEITELRVTQRSERQNQPSQGGAGSAAAGQPGRAFSGVTAAARAAGSRGVDISWLASDPDQDELTYSLYFRGEGETDWKVLQEELRQNYFQLSPDSLPDGRYRLRVIASDGNENPAGLALSAERISGPFVVDFTPPQVEVLSVSRSGSAATIRFRAWDAASVLTRAEYAVNAAPLRSVLSDDGIVDSQEETFTIQLDSLDPREHLVTFRVYDSTGNAGVGKAVLPAGLTQSGPAAGANAP